jgi:hypothetical protein
LAHIAESRAGLPFISTAIFIPRHFSTSMFLPDVVSTPTYSSWLNQIEIWFSILQGNSLAGTSFSSVQQLRDHIDAFVDGYNTRAIPFVWTKDVVHQKRLKSRFSDL